ncbi:Bax inhibitor-1/YccA family protein [Desulfurobacterium sp. TC5-1]|uniref:Bax inhibitor-1/YccA family protein n=1 Tax=Desulfurobacterium sp. TC5-1 TaxID=1158318 RepID=UPI0003B2EF12|nr:Bax inhibitor-1/YccA family protein [Desulfurobacterium sp. TC5-1]
MNRFYEIEKAGTADFASFLSKVFLNMFLGLLLTAISAYMTLATGLWARIGTVGAIGFGILSFVLVIMTGVLRKNGLLAGIMFYLFSACEGILLAPIFYIYTGASIITAFASASILFGIMALLAMTKKVDFRQFGTYLFVGLIGIIVASLLNMFLFHSAGFNMAINAITIIIFLGLTAYDIQTLEEVAYTDGNAFFGALALYLDLINLFLAILSLFGERRD